MGLGRLLRIVRGAVAAHHGWCGVTQEVLHVNFSSFMLDSPGGEGVAEAVGVDFGHPCSFTEPSQHDANGVPEYWSTVVCKPVLEKQKRGGGIY